MSGSGQVESVRKVGGHVVITREMYDDFRHMKLLAEGFAWRPCERCGQTIEVGPSGAYWHMSLPASIDCTQVDR